MSFPVYNFKKDLINVIATPELRSRFLHMPSGVKVDLYDKAMGHSHDIGYEIFLIMQGQARGLIDGEEGLLAPGDLCIAAPHQKHAFEVVGNEDVIMYLSVTPHIQPTHSFYDGEGKKLPHRFMPNAEYDVTDSFDSVEHLLRRQIELTDDLANIVTAYRDNQSQILSRVSENLGKAEFGEGLISDRDELWDKMLPVYEKMFELTSVWNTLSPNIVIK